jgi:hypothetical protein
VEILGEKDRPICLALSMPVLSSRTERARKGGRGMGVDVALHMACGL